MLTNALEPLRILCQSGPGPGYGPGYGPGWPHMMSPFGGGLIMLLLFALLIFLAARFFRQSSGGSETPLDILKRRYAKGEITREDFERLKKELKD